MLVPNILVVIARYSICVLIACATAVATSPVRSAPPSQGGALSQGGVALDRDALSGLSAPSGLGAELRLQEVGRQDLPILDLGNVVDLTSAIREGQVDREALARVRQGLAKGVPAIARRPAMGDWVIVEGAKRDAIVALDGRAVDGARWTAVPDLGAVGLTLKPDEILRLDTPRRVERSLLTEELVLSSKFLVGSSEQATDPSAGGRAQTVAEYGVRVRSLHRPLRWDGDAASYGTELTVSLVRLDEDAPGAPAWSPAGGIAMAFSDLGAGVAIEPASLTLTQSGEDGAKRAQLVYRPRTTATADFAIEGDLPKEPMSVSVAPALSDLGIRLSRDGLLALGLQEATVTVIRLGEDGLPISGAAAQIVGVTAGGSGAPPSVTIAAGESEASFPIRSSGLSAVGVAVSAAGVTRKTSIPVSFPWLLLAACLVGGFVGSLIKGQRKGRELGIGVLIGLLAFALATLGIGVTQVDPSAVFTGVGAFATAALAALVGVQVFGSEEEEDD